MQQDVARSRAFTILLKSEQGTRLDLLLASALDDGLVKLTDGYDATKPIRRARFTIRDSHPKAKWLTVSEIYTYSSNIGTVQIADKVGTKRQQEFFVAQITGYTALFHYSI